MATRVELCYHCNIRQFSNQSISVFLATSQASKCSCRYNRTDVMQGNGSELEELEEDKRGIVH